MADFDSLESVVEKVKEFDQDDEKYLAMLSQPVLEDPNPERLEKEVRWRTLSVIFLTSLMRRLTAVVGYFTQVVMMSICQSSSTGILTMKDLLIRIADKIKKKVIR